MTMRRDPATGVVGLKIFTGILSNDIDSVYTAVDAGMVPDGTREITHAVDFESIDISFSEEIKSGQMLFTVREYVDPDNAPSTLTTDPLVHGNEIVLFDNDVRNRDNRVGGKSVKRFAGILEKDVATWHYGSYRVVQWSAVDYTWMLDARYAKNLTLENEIQVQGVDTAQTAGQMVVDLLEHMYQLGVGEGMPDPWYDRFRTNVSKIVQDAADSPVIESYDAHHQLPSQVLSGLAEQSLSVWYMNIDAEVVFEPYNQREMSVGTRGLAISRGAIAVTDGSLDGFSQGLRAIVEGEVNVAIGIDTESHFDLTEQRTIGNTATRVLVSNVGVLQNPPKWLKVPVRGLFGPPTSSVLLAPASYYLRLTGSPITISDISKLGLYTFANVATGELNATPRVDYTTSIDLRSGSLPTEFTSGRAVVVLGSPAASSPTRDTLIYFPPDDVQIDDVMYIEYLVTESVDLVDHASQEFRDDYSDRTGGSSAREFIFSRLDGLLLNDVPTRKVLTRALLDRKAKLQVTGSFNTHQKGWIPGDPFLRFVRNPGRRTMRDGTVVSARPPEVMYVTNVHMTVESPVESGTGEARILTAVEYSNTQRGFNA